MKDFLSKLSLNHALKIGFGLSLLILTSVSLISYFSNSTLITNALWVDHTNRVIQKLEFVLSKIKDAEIGERGFLYSHEEKFLEPMIGSKEKVDYEIKELQLLTKDNEAQQKRLKALKVLVDSTFNKLSSTVSLFRNGDDVSKIWSTKPEVDAIRILVNKMQMEETKLLQQRLSNFKTSISDSTLFIILPSLFALLLSLISYFLIRRNLKIMIEDAERIKASELKIRDANQEIQIINEELSSTNEELVVVNEEINQSREELTAINEDLLNNIAKTEKYQSELESANIKLEEAQSIANLGNWEWDISTNRITWSKELKKIFDFDPDSVPGFDYDTYLSLIHPEDKDKVAQITEKAFKEKTSYSFDHRLLWKNGTVHWVLAKGTAHTENGVVVKLVGTALDITPLKEAENEKLKLAAIVENSFDMIRMSDQNGKGIYINDAGMKLMGFDSQEDASKYHILDYFTPESQDYITESILPEIWAKGFWSGEVEFRHFKTSEIIPVTWNVFQVKDKNNQSLGLASICQNLTNSKKAERLLHQMNDALSATVEELRQSEEGLSKANSELEERVELRTREVAASEERFRLVAMVTSDVIWDWDLITDELWWSEGFKTMFGFERSQIEPGRESWTNRIHPDDKDRISNEIKNVINKGLIVWEGEYRFLDQKGNYIYVLDKAHLLKDDKEAPVRMLGSISNITSKKTIEQERSKLFIEAENQRRQLYNMLMQAPAGIALLKGPSLIYIMANQLYYNIVGKGQEIIGKPGREALPELIDQGVWDIFDNVYKSQQTFIGNEFPVILNQNGVPSDHTSYFNFIAEPIYTFNSEIEAILLHAVEVTDQVVARKEVEEIANRFKQLLENIPQMAWTNLPSGEVTFYNQRWLNYTGLTLEMSKDNGWIEVIHPDDVDRSVQTFLKSLQTGEDFVLENRFKSILDGSFRWHLNKALPLKNERGEITLWVGTCTDIHEQKTFTEKIDHVNVELSKKNEELSKINNDLDNFIYTASHDLKAPVSNIEGLVYNLKDSLEESKFQNEDINLIIDMINQSIVRFKNTIGDLTEISKIQKNTNEDISNINILEVIEDAKLDIQDMINSSGATIEMDIDPDTEINFSRKNLKSIVYNLLSNAVKYHSERPPLVSVKTIKEENAIVLIVKDNGLGMDLTGESKIFTMFKRLHDHVEGTGIGLYLVKRIIDNAGGRIEVKSKVGEGSEFKVYFNLS